MGLFFSQLKGWLWMWLCYGCNYKRNHCPAGKDDIPPELWSILLLTLMLETYVSTAQPVKYIFHFFRNPVRFVTQKPKSQFCIYLVQEGKKMQTRPD